MDTAYESAPRGARSTFLDDVLEGLGRMRKSLPCKYFYDAEGSRLFEAITDLDEYYLTRAEVSIFDRHAREMAEALGPRVLLIEPGAGSERKIERLLPFLRDLVGYVPVDVAGEHLSRAVARLRTAHPHLWVRPVEADFTRPFVLPEPPREPRRRVVFFPGSTIGNFEPTAARRLLADFHRLASPGGAILLGIDLVKDVARLVRAYDDPAGVTAAFDKHLLVRINRELRGNFVLDRFEHVARFDSSFARIEMSLRSLVDQRVQVSGRTFDFLAGEEIVTEHSHKYTKASLAELVLGTGFVATRWFTDEAEDFAVVVLESDAQPSRDRRAP